MARPSNEHDRHWEQHASAAAGRAGARALTHVIDGDRTLSRVQQSIISRSNMSIQLKLNETSILDRRGSSAMETGGDGFMSETNGDLCTVTRVHHCGQQY